MPGMLERYWCAFTAICFAKVGTKGSFLVGSFASGCRPSLHLNGILLARMSDVVLQCCDKKNQTVDLKAEKKRFYLYKRKF